MGDISRHRDIYLNTREVIPDELLGKCKLSKADMTYLEIGNYLTDVSQFRDPVMYIFAKQRIWREFIIPKTGDKMQLARGLSVLIGATALATSEILKSQLANGTAKDIAKYSGPILAGLGGLIAILPNDLYAGIAGADTWIDKMFGTPIERTIGDLKKRDEKHYGYIGQFFRYFIEGVTQWLFAEEITSKVTGEWAKVGKISEKSITEIYTEFYTQYYPHEHTDMPPYVWDASKRPQNKPWYGPSKRQHTIEDKVGVMNAVDNHYIQYMSESLSDLEQEWRKLKPDDLAEKRKWLVKVGKILHGIEDWYFHSNVVELVRLRGHKPAQRPDEDTDAFVKRFVEEVLKNEPEFMDPATTTEKQIQLQRILYRRLRYPTYLRGDRIQSGGKISKETSEQTLHHAYPAFPSQQDTAHTLLGALKNLERKVMHPDTSGGMPSAIPPWAPCVLNKFRQAKDGAGQKLFEEKAKARGVPVDDLKTKLNSQNPQDVLDAIRMSPSRNQSEAVIIDVLREWIPLIVTLLNEHERQRLVADVDYMQWPIDGTIPDPPLKEKPGSGEEDKQVLRHKLALEPKVNEHGAMENNYDRAARYLGECGFLNKLGEEALNKSFEIDATSQKLLEGAPGSGGFLIQFAVDLQRQLDEGDKEEAKLNKKKESRFEKASDNGSFHEIIGSHSLMSKDTLISGPFFNDSKVLASVASSSVFHILLEQITGPKTERRLPWKIILQHFIRFPSKQGGWERRAMEFFKTNGEKIPKYSDLPELAKLVESALASKAALEPWKKGTKDDELKEMYIKLEMELSQYRYP